MRKALILVILWPLSCHAGTTQLGSGLTQTISASVTVSEVTDTDACAGNSDECGDVAVLKYDGQVAVLDQAQERADWKAWRALPAGN